MKKNLSIISVLLCLLCLCFMAQGQTQVVANGKATQAITMPGTCTYNWINSNPSIGLAANGTGNIPSFTALNTGSSIAYATITAVPQRDPVAYVPNVLKSQILLLNTTTRAVINTIQLGTAPKAMAFSPDGTKTYILATRLYTISTQSQMIIDSTSAIGSTGTNMIASPDGSRLYITSTGVPGVVIFNTATKAVGHIYLDDDLTTHDVSITSLAISPDGSKLYTVIHRDSIVSPTVTIPLPGRITVYNTLNNNIAANIPINPYPSASVITADGSKLYVSANHVLVVSLTANKLVDSISAVTSAGGMVLSPDGAKLYAVNSGNSTVYVISTSTGQTISTGVFNGANPKGISITPDGSKLEVINTSGADEITEIGTSFNTATNINTGASATIFAPWFGNFITQPGNSCSAYTVNITVTPTPTTPTIITNGTPNVITTNAGTASASSSFTASAYKLTEGIKLTAPAGFEISTDNITFSNTLTVGTGGDIADTKIYVRIPASAAVGSYSGNIKLGSAGAPGVTVAISGQVSPTGSIVPNITVYNGVQVPDIKLPGTGCIDTWQSDKPGIGLNPMSVGIKIPSFTAVNTGTVPITATISVSLYTFLPLQNAHLAFIVNQFSGRVWSYNTDDNNSTKSAILSGAEPYGIALNADRSIIYVTNRGDGTVSATKITYEPHRPPAPDSWSPFPLNPIDLGGKTKKPEGIAVTPDGSTLYVANSGDGTVAVISTYNNQLAKTISLGTLNPCGVVISPDGSKVYVTNTGSGNISVISTATNTVTGNIATGSSPQGITISADGSKLYVANQGSNSVSVINTANNTSTSINVGSQPLGICISLDGSRVYVANQGSNDISVIDAASNTEIKRIAVGSAPSGISVSPDGSVVYVCCLNDANVYMVNTSGFGVTTFDGSNYGGTPGPFSFGNFIDGPAGCAVPFTFTITILPTPPSLSADGYLPNLTTSQGVASDISRFNVSGLSLSEGVLVTPPDGYEVSTDSVNFSKTVVVGAAGNITAAPVYIRLAASTLTGSYPGNIVLSSAGATSISEPVNGTVTAAVPAIVVSPVSGTIKGCAGSPSVSLQQFTVSAVSLKGVLTAHAPTGFELSLSPTSDFTTNLQISSLATVPNTIIYVRAALTATGTLSGNVTISSPGISKTVAVFGAAYPSPTINPVQSQTIVAGGKPSLPINFTGTGNAYRWVNDRPDILDASGSGDIAPFVGINNTNSDIVAHITAVPVSSTMVYVTNKGDNSISAIDASTNTLVATITVGSSPQNILITPDATRLYVANNGDGTVSVINTGNNTNIATIHVGNNPGGLGLNADGSILTVSSDVGYTTINTTTFVPIQTTNTGIVSNQSMAVSPDGTIGYSTYPPTANQVFVTDMKTGKVITTIQVGAQPLGLTLTPDGTMLYVANSYNNTVSVINTSTYEVVDDIRTPNFPNGVFSTGGTGCSGNAITFTITVEPVPPIIVAKGKLDSLGTIQGNPSRSTSFTVSGTRMQDVIKATAPIGFEVSTDNINFSNSITFGAAGTIASTTVYVRLAASTAVGTWFGDVTLSSQGAGSVAMPTYAINNVTEPVSTVAIGFVTGNIAACAGTPSSSPNIKQFQASGYLLSTDITVTAPNGFEVSVNATSGYSGSLTLGRVPGDSVQHTTIYVRSAATALGSIAGDVLVSAAGATTKKAAVTGVVSPLPTVNQVPDQVYAGDKPIPVVTFTGTANTYSWTNDNVNIGIAAASGYAGIPAFTGINKGSAPQVAHITVTPIAASLAYIANSGSNTVSVINTSSNSVVNRIPLPGGAVPLGVVVSPDGTRIYVTEQGANSVVAINAITNTVIKAVGAGSSPSSIVISPDGSTLYITDSGSDNIEVISTSNFSAFAIPIGTTPSGIAISPDGSKIYVTVRNALTPATRIVAINTVTLDKTYYSAGASPEQAAVSADGNTLYVSNYNDASISAINLITGAITTIPVGLNPEALVPSADGKSLYVACSGANAVSVVTLATKAVSNITIGKNPQGVSLNADGSMLYVTNAASGSVSVINTATNKVVTTTTVEGSPISYGNFISAGTACPGNPMTFKYVINPSSGYISVTGALAGLNTSYGTASASASISASGISMVSGILVTPPAGFEVSLDNKTFSPTVNFGAAGTIAAITIYIRLAGATPVGTYTGNVTLSSTGAADALVAIPNSTVTATPLTITADNKSRVAGKDNPILTATYMGFVNNETSAVLTTQPVLSTTATISSPVGQYPIDVSGATATNYTFVYVPGVLTVNLGEQTISIPNAFTPNGDGINDTWVIPALANYTNFTVTIFNRLGQSLYFSNNYPIPWDGTYHGAALPTGVYYYIINVKGASKPFAGDVTIIR